MFARNKGGNQLFFGHCFRFTFVVPTNAAWERVQLDFSKAYNTLVEGQFPNYVI